MENELFRQVEGCLLRDTRPSAALDEWMRAGAFSGDASFARLEALVRTEQSPVWHPEGNVWNHTLQVVDLAATCRGESRDPRVFMWAALLHDIGKPATTRLRKGRLTAYDHDRAGERLCREFLAPFAGPAFIDRVAGLVRWHMQALYCTKNGASRSLAEMVWQVDIEDIARLALCDRLGRGTLTEEKRREETETVKKFEREARRAAERPAAPHRPSDGEAVRRKGKNPALHRPEIRL